MSCKVEPSALTCGCVPVDLDVTLFDNSKTHKEGVSRTYKNFDGYAPMMAYIGTVGMLAYNILRIIGTEAMKKNDMPVHHKTIKRRRIRTVIDRLILIAGHLTVHARQMKLALGKSNSWANAFIRIYNAFATL